MRSGCNYPVLLCTLAVRQVSVHLKTRCCVRAPGNAVTLVSGLADASTPGIDRLLASRAASMFAGVSPPSHRFDETPNLAAAASTVVLGSHPNGLPAGLSLHAELRARVAAGLSDSGRDMLCELQLPVGEDHLRPASSERFAEGCADPRGPSCDERD